MNAKNVMGGKVRYGVVAGGMISQAHFMPGVRNTKNSELTVLVTGDPEKAEALKQEFGLRKTYHYDDFDELLAADEVDALYIATPNHLHTKFVVPALKAGIHVLLEKPMAVNEEDCKAMIAAAEEGGAKLMLAYRLHFEPATVAAIEHVRAGDIGEARLFTATFTQAIKTDNHRAKHGFDAGPVYDIGVYPINAARQLFGSEPIEVHAVGARNPEWGLEDMDDTVSVTLRFPGDRIASFVVSYTLNSFEHYAILGTKGNLSFQPAFSYGHGLEYDATIGDETEHQTFPEVDQFGSQAEYFSDCILDDLDPEPDGEEGWCDVRIVEAIRRALITGRPQALEPYTRKRRVEPTQVRGLAPPEPVEMVNAEDPSENRD
ncbi:Gfo/Idh/MocA family protein [Paludisphaera soli]|uniref:Gfo/Idh/MocA family protein n=1 Tax=Paludisphaera soli TaxID=2712865 RepID=UPI0013ED1B93|nr:Gfo/Idh/MocA family oxidoreductase [Paludisphaera soli]